MGWAFLLPYLFCNNKSRHNALFIGKGIALKLPVNGIGSQKEPYQTPIAQIMASKIKKGAKVRAVREKLADSLEAKASDPRFPAYIFESKGEVVELNEEYALVRFYVPTPNVWFRIDQIELAE